MHTMVIEELRDLSRALLAYGQRATFFIITDRVGQAGYLTWPELREMAAHGMSIQSHGCSHSSLAHVALSDARKELWQSKDCLEQALGRRITAFAVPGGSWRPALSRLATECGYHIVCTSDQGINYPPFNPLALKRLSLRRNYSASRVHSLVRAQPLAILRQRLEAFSFNCAKAFLGWDRYNVVRRRLLARVSGSLSSPASH